nr:hypothetical protein [Singulisphaera sp. GP187]
MHHALNSLAVAAPKWLRDHSPSEWVDRSADAPTNPGSRLRKGIGRRTPVESARMAMRF